MPNIPIFDAPSNLGLQPTEMGVDARAAVARRGGAFYQQAADAITGTVTASATRRVSSSS